MSVPIIIKLLVIAINKLVKILIQEHIIEYYTNRHLE